MGVSPCRMGMKRLKGAERRVDIFQNRKTRGCGITKSTILTKKIMLNVAGWKYGGKGCPYEDFDKPSNKRRYGYMVYAPNGERILAATTRNGIDDFCMKIYKEFYNTHPEEHDWLPDPYN